MHVRGISVDTICGHDVTPSVLRLLQQSQVQQQLAAANIRPRRHDTKTQFIII